MLQGILWAVGAGIMLGLYALPEKYIKGYKYENTWFLFFLIALIILPLIAGFGLINNFGAILSSIPSEVLWTMVGASFLWGVGVQFWSKAINYIGMSLGFSIFIGAVILIGSILPFIVDGLPSPAALKYIMAGLVVILVGIGANGRAGILKMGNSDSHTSKHMMRGILIALIGGLFATGFSLANAVGVKPITEAVLAEGNPVWMSAIAVMCIIYWAGALYAIPYFIIQLCKNGSWSNFTNSFGRNVSMAFIMAFLNFAASAAFAYAAFSLGGAGNTIGYAIYNTASVLLAVIGGILTKEWVSAPAASRKMLYLALGCMIAGVVLIAMGNSVA
ncbi:MAG: L-rhamnose/proton symporter RhaT [Rikenellaceae bacterium]